jgi:hypothetical protein
MGLKDSSEVAMEGIALVLATTSRTFLPSLAVAAPQTPEP